ncbi:hypothetical protein ACQCSX_04385 [Pseudarthrobacter sp. P1]|uniref:hypothetical protein n=1 Tax=Pseudarthrobacter sp. P1 TaxID=3418418 RepID=UPI003CFA5ACC
MSRRPNNSITSATTLTAQERDTAALRRRTDDPDVSWQQIADEFDYASRGAACKQVMGLHRRNQKEASDEFRAAWDDQFNLALDEIKTIINGAYPIPDYIDPDDEDDAIARIVDAVKRDGKLKLEAIDRLVKVNDRLAKMHGFDQPTKIEATGPAFTVLVDPDMLPDGTTVTSDRD